MKVVAFNGSARAKGNTAILLNVVLAELRQRRHRDGTRLSGGGDDSRLPGLLSSVSRRPTVTVW